MVTSTLGVEDEAGRDMDTASRGTTAALPRASSAARATGLSSRERTVARSEGAASALCCAPTRSCGDARIDALQAPRDDGKFGDADDCLNTWSWRILADHGAGAADVEPPMRALAFAVLGH